MHLLSNLFRFARPGRETRTIQLLTRPGCHLCDDAYAALRREFHDESITTVNILTDRVLEDAYVFRIPVVLHADQVLAEGIIDGKVARDVRRQVARCGSSKTGSS